MRDRDVRQLDKHERQSAFATENAADFPAGSRGERLMKLMRDDIALIKRAAAGQISGAGERAQQIETKEEDLEDLMEWLKLLDYAADMLADDFPGIENLFGVPRNRSEQSIVAAGRSQHDLSAQYEAAMIEEDVPATFRSQMKTLIERIEQRNESADIAGENSSGSVAEINAAMSRLAKNSKKFDALCRIKYRGNAAKMGAWERANHLERDPKGNKSSNNPLPTP